MNTTTAEKEEKTCEVCGRTPVMFFETGFANTDFQYLCSGCREELKGE